MAFLTPKFSPSEQAARMVAKELELARKQEIMRELKKISKRAARSADLTHTARGSVIWTAEFKRVLEGGRPLRPQPKGLTHRPTIQHV